MKFVNRRVEKIIGVSRFDFLAKNCIVELSVKKGTNMKNYKSIAEAAGTTIDIVREVAANIYEDVTGWRYARAKNADKWARGYRTKGEAIEAIAKHKQAELDKAKAEREAIKADTEAAYKLMAAAGHDPHGDIDKATAIVSSLETLADTMGVTVADLTVDDFHEAGDGGPYHSMQDVRKAMDDHTPVRIYTTDCAIWDYIAGIEGANIVHTEHFGAVQILDNAANVYPWDMNPTDRPLLCAGGANLTWKRGTLVHAWYESTCPNHKGERLTVEVDTINGGNGHDGWILTEWAKRGYIKHMASAWNTNVYVRAADGKTTQAYNPQNKPNGETEFSWILEQTEANRLALLVETLKRFGNAE